MTGQRCVTHPGANRPRSLSIPLASPSILHGDFHYANLLGRLQDGWGADELRQRVEDELRPRVNKVRRDLESSSFKELVRTDGTNVIIDGALWFSVAVATQEPLWGAAATAGSGVLQWIRKAYTRAADWGGCCVDHPQPPSRTEPASAGPCPTRPSLRAGWRSPRTPARRDAPLKTPPGSWAGAAQRSTATRHLVGGQCGDDCLAPREAVATGICRHVLADPGITQRHSAPLRYSRHQSCWRCMLRPSRAASITTWTGRIGP
jgi:hypothetical protein